MTDEELVSKIQAGDTELRAQLLRQFGSLPGISVQASEDGSLYTGYKVIYSGLILHIAKRYTGTINRVIGVDFEDILQACAEGVLLAADKYRPSEKSFRNFALWFIKRAVYNALGLREGHPYRFESSAVICSLEAPVDGGEDSPTLEECFSDDRQPSPFPDPCESLLETDLRETVRAAVARLPDEERRRVYDSAPSPTRKRAYRLLHNDKKLLRLWQEYFAAPYTVGHIGICSFRNTHTSETEAAAFRRLEIAGRLEAMGIPIQP